MQGKENDFQSDVVFLKEIYTFNKIERMNLGMRLELNKMLKAKAYNAWKAALLTHPAPRPERKHAFVLQSYVLRSHNLPDTDAFMWLAKRFIDGAVKVGVIPDDTTKHLSHIIIAAPQPLNPDLQGTYRGMAAAAHVGIFTRHPEAYVREL